MTSRSPLDTLYFDWLYQQIGSLSNKNPRRSHRKLARRLYETEFIFFVRLDENRAWDGVGLRNEFFWDNPNVPPGGEWADRPCSMLEMLIALAKRADFLADYDAMPGGVGAWFHEFIGNAGLEQYTDDRISPRSLEEIDFVIAQINNRTYARDGSGGILPLQRVRRDQRRMELWSQLHAYLTENGYVSLDPDH